MKRKMTPRIRVHLCHPPACNLCGKPLDGWDLRQNIHIHKTLGYGSAHDGDALDLRLCCGCIDLLVSMCRVSPVQGGAPHGV